MARKINEAGIELIKRFEGCRLAAYKLAGETYYTIGYGHSYDKSITADTIWTQEQAEKVLRQDLEKFEEYTENTVKNIIPTDNQFAALVSYCYNRGLGKTDCSNGLRQLAANSNSAQEYADNFLIYWGTAVTYKKGLLERRKAERELFLSGVINTEASLPSNAGLSEQEVSKNILIVQKWLNQEYKSYIQKCKKTDCMLLREDGKMGNKTKGAITIALQVFLNTLGADLEIDGEYGTKTNAAVREHIAVKEETHNVSAKIVQAILYCYQYNPQTFREEFNSECVTALKLCQEDNHLNVDGVAGVIFFSTFLKEKL
ncbi:glycoside hydrolase family protein [Konateibacter massiliensis]|uniref:glycoside hydrolase family protein n=1 Tax=Konateibacter massiliensis TaxID=2002841 RepID=UPI000C148F7C|nr:lysozyme [Konateibacter massiliensis]